MHTHHGPAVVDVLRGMVVLGGRAWGKMEERIIVQSPLTWERMGFPAPLLSFLHMDVLRDREREIHCKAAVSPGEDVHWAAG